MPPLASTPLAALAAELIELGRAGGLDAVGIASGAPFERARVALEDRKARGLHDGMAFTFKNPARSTDPGAAVRGAQAIVVGARSYLRADPLAPERPSGRVARYARGDQYAPLREALWVIARRLRAAGFKAVVFADDNSLVDREAAYRAGLGWYGKSANLLLPGAGSWFVLGSVVTDAPLVPATAPTADGCGSCRRCLDGCPTGAIVAPGVVDAGRCLAWLLQKPGVFAREQRVALGDRIYGCDDCQDVCPPNQVVLRRGEATPPVAGEPASGDQAWVDLVGLLEADDDTVLARHGRWYLADRDPVWLRRNALIALGNTADGHDSEVVRVLAAYLAHPDAILRAPALWAARRLGRVDLAAHLRDDGDPLVADEWAAPHPPVRTRPPAAPPTRPPR